MSVIIFGNGPMTNEAAFSVTAPGSRTWQIVRTVADGLVQAGAVSKDILVFGLDETPRPTSAITAYPFTVESGGHKIEVEYRPLAFESFRSVGVDPASASLPLEIRAIVATGSAQPYATAAALAKKNSLPLWVDVFGDPICETQSQLELIQQDDPEYAETRLIHVWKLHLDGLLQGDTFSALSRRQRHAMHGQLGCAGRLNQHTASHSFCHYLPYAVFHDDLPPLAASSKRSDRFTVMWCGSFNTWMDVPTLTRGITRALQTNPKMHLMVVGGKIPGYNEVSYRQFQDGVTASGVQDSVTLLDWQPLSRMYELYQQCDLGISIDRYTYEAELGSRTRLINFLAAGIPVTSTIVTELSADLARDGMLLPFDMGDPQNLTDVLLKASSGDIPSAQQCRQYVLEKYNGQHWGDELRQWIASPTILADKAQLHNENTTNELASHWQKVREPLGL